MHLPTGVTGTVGFLKRGTNRYQVTLSSHPLYTFMSDSRSGQANGQRIQQLRRHLVRHQGRDAAGRSDAGTPARPGVSARLLGPNDAGYTDGGSGEVAEWLKALAC